MEYQKEIKTPLGGHAVVFKTMVTGAEREQIDTAKNKYLKTTDGQNFTVTDMQKIELATKHELLKVCVLTIDGDPTNCFERLQKMSEHDYAFVFDAILEEQKKMKPSTSTAS